MKIINNIKETRAVIVVEDKANIMIVMLLYVLIKRETEPSWRQQTSLQEVDIMKKEETSELILVDIHISRMYSDVLSRFWTSHREGV